jgi:outer membrane protein assembly factor BamB
MGGDGPRATPTYESGVVYSLGATGEFRALDALSGKVKWGKNILNDNNASNLSWGMSAGPLIVGNKVIVQPGGGAGNSIVAYDKATGNRVWGTLDDRQAYTSPMLVTMDGKSQILAVTAKRAVGLEPETGKLLWEYPWTTQFDVNSAQPVVVDGNHVALSSGYGHGAALIEVRGSTVKNIWKNKHLKTRFNSPVLYEGYLYGLDEGIFSCIRVSDGEQMWKGGRYGYGQNLLVGDQIIVLTEAGELVLVRATPEKLVEVSRSSAIEGKTWNVPAIEGGILLVRNGNEMAAFDLRQ